MPFALTIDGFAQIVPVAGLVLDEGGYMRLEFERPGSARAASLDEAFSGLFHATRKLGFDAVIYDYTPVPPLESLRFVQEISDEFVADFSNLDNA